MGEKLIPAVAVTPVPVSATVCGEPAALSATLTDAENEAADAGVNVALMVQEAFASTVVAQLFVCAKSLGLLPVSVIPEMSRLAFPVLVRVIARAALVVPVVWFPNATDVGEKLTIGAATEL